MKSDFEFVKTTLDTGQECLEDKPIHDSTMVVRRTIKPEVAAAKTKQAKKTKSVDIVAPEPVNSPKSKPDIK